MLKIPKKSVFGVFFVFLSLNCLFSQVAKRKNIEKINQVDANGKRTGIWKKFYENGNIRYQGQFRNGQEFGTFKFYEPHVSHPTIVKEYSTETDAAKVTFYTRRGKIKAQGMMKDKIRRGEWAYFYNNGKPLSIDHYNLEGKLDGVSKTFYPNGKITSEVYYTNGVLNGVSKRFSDSGILIEQLTYKNDVLDGPAKFFNLKGNLIEEGNFAEGIRKGHWDYYVDGQPTSKKPKREKFNFKK